MNTATSKGTKSRGNTDLQAAKMLYPRDARKDQIEREIAHYQRMENKGLSMRQIAKRIGMSPSGHLMSILWDMAEESRLIAKKRDYRDGIAWTWQLPSKRLSQVIEKTS